MSDADPNEFQFGLPEEVADRIRFANSGDVDEWELETLFTEAAFAYQDRQQASGVGEIGSMSELIASAEEMTWGIDEPMTAADFAFLDDDWPEL